MAQPQPTPRTGVSPAKSEPPSQPPPPWRAEGLPPTDGKRSWWPSLVWWVVGYAIVFGLLTLQDRLNGPEAISYTAFKAQVAAQNVAEIFSRGDSI